MQLLASSCFDGLSIQAEESTVTLQVQRMIDSKQPIPVECLEMLLHRGYYKAALKLYEDYFVTHKKEVAE